MNKKTAIIIGAGPAGLTAAYELINKTDIKPMIFEMTGAIGGISKTINYKGNRIDIGGHRFFSKSDRIMEWWFNILPLQGKPAKDDIILNRNILGLESKGPDPEISDKVMLIRNRLSRIFFLRKFFDYPITINLKTFSNLGIKRIIKIVSSYMWIKIFPLKEEKSLEDFFINRFGNELYKTFFKDYTEKIWGVSCREIEPEWGSQRIKGLSITKAAVHALKSIFSKDNSLKQENTETSLIEKYFYPKFGPGQMWEEVAKIIQKKGGKIYFNKEVIGITFNNEKITGISIKDVKDNNIIKKNGDFFFSSMPVKDLIKSMGKNVPEKVRSISNGLMYRDFITVGLLLKKMNIKNNTRIKTINNLTPDNWIYIQERDVKIGRLQIFNNWSPYMVSDLNNIWIGLEYFCNIGDELWEKPDKDFIAFAISELAKIDIIDKENVLDSTIIRSPKTYPAYFGSYNSFSAIREYTDNFPNLFLIGRNGMHRYNNQDHSMLTAITAVDNIINNVKTKDNIWDINTEQQYHESKNAKISQQ